MGSLHWEFMQWWLSQWFTVTRVNASGAVQVTIQCQS